MTEEKLKFGELIVCIAGVIGAAIACLAVCYMIGGFVGYFIIPDKDPTILNCTLLGVSTLTIIAIVHHYGNKLWNWEL